MRVWLFAGAITFSTFALVAMLMSAFVSWIAPALARRLEQYSAASRAALLFRVRMLPAGLAAVGAFGIALPVFFKYEPRSADESLARTVILLAAAGGALIARGGWRAARAWRATCAVQRDWQRRGRRLHTLTAPLPVYAIEEPFPTVAVVGILRPALFVSERVIAECTEAEMRAMLLHECAHVTRHDNLKRFLIRACPDIVETGSALDRAWSFATEEAADAAAVANQPRSALELAQALIRVARLAPVPKTPELASAFYLGGSIEFRVRRLVDPPGSPDAYGPFGWVMAATLCIVAAFVAAGAAPALHHCLETAVRLLP